LSKALPADGFQEALHSRENYMERPPEISLWPHSNQTWKPSGKEIVNKIWNFYETLERKDYFDRQPLPVEVMTLS
jgi:hypothetical protein